VTTSLSSAVPTPIRRPSRAGRLAARDSYLSYRLKPRSTSRSITSALDRLVFHPRRDRSTSIMTSAQPGGSYEDRRETHGCSRHLAPPDHPRVYPLICARVENERVSRRPNDEANGARRDGARSARRSAAAAAAAGKKRRFARGNKKSEGGKTPAAASRSLRPRTSPACFVPSEDTSVRTRAAGIGSPARSRLPQARAAFTPDEKSHPRLPKKRRPRAKRVRGT
jgi:hypothetical protein